MPVKRVLQNVQHQAGWTAEAIHRRAVELSRLGMADLYSDVHTTSAQIAVQI